MPRAVIGIVLVATIIGALMPTGSQSVSGAEANAGAAAVEPWFAEDGSSSDPAGSSEVRLTRNRNGHFYADVLVNGTNVEFMIDTGATGIALTAADARRAGVDLDPSRQTYVGEGAGGSLTGQQVSLDRVRLGGRSASGMRAVVIDGASTNLLGQSFLSQFPEVTVRGDVMTLR